MNLWLWRKRLNRRLYRLWWMLLLRLFVEEHIVVAHVLLVVAGSVAVDSVVMTAYVFECV